MTLTKAKHSILRSNNQHFLNHSENSIKDLTADDFFEIFNYPVLFFNHNKIGFNYFAKILFGYSKLDLETIPQDKIIEFQLEDDNSFLQKRKITITKSDGAKFKFSAINFMYKDVEAWLLYHDDENAILEDNIGDRGKILSMIYENTSDAMALINVDGTKNFSILSVNRTFTEISGFSKDKCIGKNIEEVFPANILNVLIGAIRLLVKNKRRLKTEVNLFIQDESRYLDSSVIPILNKSGQCVFILLVAHDITDRKKKEDELLKAKNEAEESSRLKATLLANMSHEVRTPLTGILGFAELLEEELIQPEHQLLAQSIRKSGKRLLYTLNSIIELSRLEAEKMEIYKRKMDLREILQQLSKRFRPEAELKGLSFDIEMNVSEISLHIDSSLFNQIMINLIDNAIKFTKNGSVKIIIDKEIDETKSHIAIKVIDTGIGISKNNLKTIFKEFKQESEGWGRSHEGIGLGLSLVKRMTELMSGSVSVQSEKYKGSTFIVRFPIFTEGLYETINPTSDIDNQTKTLHKSISIPAVLLVEDNELNTTLTKLYLKQLYTIDHAPDANTALKMIQAKNYDVILMDINLGDGMNGVDALYEIRKMAQYRITPIIALTGYAIGLDEKNLLECGFNGYLAKPFEKNQLLKLVGETLLVN